jgi:hypothetical protein
VAIGIFNPNPPLAILDQGGVGNWHVLSWSSWEVQEPSYAVDRYSWGDSRIHTVEVFGEGLFSEGLRQGRR